ncbi:MAG: M23 family metallopeptidase, partial [Oscillospiraceae bacterium]
LGSNHVFQPDQIVTSILRTSGKDIVQATGFYVDGQFYGATTDRLQLEQDIESFKAPYMDGDADSTVEFVQNVELIDGVYIADSVVEYSDISKLLYSTKQGEVNYTVKNGDTLSGIASENGITQNELIALNPQLAESKAMFHPGDIFVMSKAQAFLQVKVVKRIVEQVEIPYASTQSQSGDLGFGKRKVTVEGVKGLKDVTSDLTYIDGVMVDKTLVQEVVISEPVTEEVVIGTYIAPGVVAVPGTGQMMWPVPGYKYVSRGFAGHFPAHNGLDICAGYGTPIYASDNGVVTKAAYTGVGYGVHVIINHGNGLVSLYAHCSSLAVTTGQTVTKGQIIGYIGSTGWSTGNHCHYEISNGSTRFNPMNYF